jgi:hypothetical protein
LPCFNKWIQLSKSQMKKLPLLFLVLVFLPMFIGLPLAARNLLQLFVVHTPTAQDWAVPLPLPAAEQPSPREKKKIAWILLNPLGTQIAEVFSVYEALAESGTYLPFLVSTEQRALPLTAPLMILPHFVVSRAPEPELIVVPSMILPEHQAIQDVLKMKAAAPFLGIGEGVRALALAKILDGKKATTSALQFKAYQKEFPAVLWEQSTFVSDGSILTSATAPQAIEFLSSAGTQQKRQSSSLELNFNPGLKDAIFLFLNLSYQWGTENVGVEVSKNFSETALGNTLDILPRSFRFKTYTTSEKREWIRSKHGLWVLPVLESPSTLPPTDLTLKTIDWNEHAPDPFQLITSHFGDVHRQIIVRQKGSPEAKQFSLIQAAQEDLMLFFRPLLLGMFGVTGLSFYWRRKRKPSTHKPAA